jgi:SAM-dependent methyltransferase
MEIKPFESKLGEKSYWDNFYSEEFEQFKNNSDLIGEIWFGKNVQKKEVEYIIKYCNNEMKILDVGCGNAALLMKLYKKGFRKLYGMDYSENSISLANEIISNKLDTADIQLFVDDISEPSINHKELINFDFIHDKGTFDAYMSDKTHKACAYLEYILGKFKTIGMFFLTSCNYTKNELLDFIAERHSRFFNLRLEIPYKTFSYGGSRGQTVTSLIFDIQKVDY